MDKIPNVFDNAPLIGWIHNISKNQLKYLNSQIEELNLGREMRYIMIIYDNPNCSQDDLVNIYGESKANIAKSLKKLENEGYIIRKVNPKNRRKYMLKTTKKAEDVVPKIRQISLDWEIKVGIDENDYELKEKIKKIAINSMNLIDNKEGKL
ncbi:MAG: MarR family winged helix-turn-helix transcriptional regulator [Methanobrevibacter sp.]|uniref:MarR family winged helix-turn-helix transcriptional regulator n=1 Tax=Methanobrevibacter sp. TaxID=66852 RepID=UPI003F0EA99A